MDPETGESKKALQRKDIWLWVPFSLLFKFSVASVNFKILFPKEVTSDHRYHLETSKYHLK